MDSPKVIEPTALDAAMIALVGLEAIVDALHDAKVIDGATVAAQLEKHPTLPPGATELVRMLASACRKPRGETSGPTLQ